MKWGIYIWFLVPWVVFGQERQGPKYGAHTTQYFTENDIIYKNDTAGTPIDTSFEDVHLYEFNLQDKQWKQDLGNIGTAMQPLYYSSPQIGTRLGMDVYDGYVFKNKEVRYYDTKSPYSRLNYVQGFRGQQVFEVTFSRNINPRWNFGLDFRRITSKFQYGALEETRQTSNYAFQGFTKYSSKDHRYQLLINFIRIDHAVVETGGVHDTIVQELIYDPEEAFPNMFNLEGTTPESSDNRVNYHVYHQFDLSGTQKLNLFHTFDRKKQRIRFRDYELEENLDYYDKKPRDSSSIDYRYSLETIDNAVGLKGDLSKIFYRVYFKNRLFKYDIDSLNWETEQFVGGDFNINFSDSLYWKNQLEVSTNAEYSYATQVRYKNLEARAQLKSYTPSMFERTYYGDFEQWNNDFENTSEQLVGLGYQLKLGQQRIGLDYQFNNISNLVYFATDGRPDQSTSSSVIMNGLALDMRLQLGILNFINYTKFYKVSSSLWRAPQWFSRNSIYLAEGFFDEVLKFKFGADLFIKSGYKGYGYDPVIQQFYLQNDKTLGPYPVVDIFLDVNIKVADLFFKLTHVNQGWWGQGYEVTPGYVGTRRMFVFGVKWRFYN